MLLRKVLQGWQTAASGIKTTVLLILFNLYARVDIFECDLKPFI